MHKIVIAFDSFKGCMTAEEACPAAAQAIHEVLPAAEVVECPLSDGGEGLVDCIAQILPVKCIHLKAHDPLMNIIDASYVVDEKTSTAYMEMAATSGLTLVPLEKRNPMVTTTYGVGDMIIDATRRGCKEIIMGIGGSATCDGGKGMIQCLWDNGYFDTAQHKYFDTAQHKYSLPSDKLPHITVASDVTNPLYGKQGAAFVFGPQKGATPKQVSLLDEQLRAFARETEEKGLATRDLAEYPGAGAAGGLGYGLMAYLKARLESGIDIILDIKRFNDFVKETDLVITGEGKSDEQTLMGKVPHGVLLRTKTITKTKTAVWLLSGCIDDKDGMLSRNFDLVRSINEDDSRPMDVLMQSSVAKDNLRKTIKKIIEQRKQYKV